ncbi:Translin, partial [Meira miltonrushii]
MTSVEVPIASTSRATIIQDTFGGFRSEIDAYNDRRDRLIKASRDITTASKRLIFHLHRFPHAAFGKDIQPKSGAGKILAEGRAKKDEIVSMIIDLARREGLTTEEHVGGGIEKDVSMEGTTITDVFEPGRATRYDRAYGGGLEEFIEGISFLHFLEHGNVITLEEVQSLFVKDGQIILPVTPQRYVLGLSDLSGELMRFATNALGDGDAHGVVSDVLRILRSLCTGLDPFVPLIRDFRKKQQVTMQSMRKI